MIVKLTESYTESYSIKLDFIATTPTWFNRSYKLSYRLSRFNSTTVRPASMHILIWLMLRHTYIIENMHKTLNLFVANCARVQYTHLCVVLVFGEATSKQNIWLCVFTLEQVSVHDFQGCIILSQEQKVAILPTNISNPIMKLYALLPMNVCYLQFTSYHGRRLIINS